MSLGTVATYVSDEHDKALGVGPDTELAALVVHVSDVARTLLVFGVNGTTKIRHEPFEAPAEVEGPFSEDYG